MLKTASQYCAVVLTVVFFAGCASLEMEEEKSRFTVVKQQEVKQVVVQQPEVKKVVPEKLFIDDFNAGVKPNMLGGGFGGWDKDPTDKTQFCKESFDYDVKVGDEGFSVKLVYDVDSKNPAYNGFWMKLEGTDFRPYKKLCLSVKGNRTTKFTDKFKIELKNAKGEVGRALIMGVTEQWQEKVVVFENFRGITDFAEMTEFVIVFDDITSTPKTGTINIDNIYVAK
ncbi:MAG: hypothetical protein ABID79_02930 [Elusimicrobiota bacterium]